MGGLKPLHEQVIVTPNDVTPSSPDMDVLGVFNPGGAFHNSETNLLLRVMEQTNEEWEGHFPIPSAEYTKDGSYKVNLTWLREGIDARKADEHAIETIEKEERIIPMHISNFRRIKSKDGIEFEVSDKPDFFPWMPYEKYGIEDPSITSFEGEGIKIGEEFYKYLMAYVACSPTYEISTAFAVTKNFTDFKRLPLKDSNPKPIFTVNNKDVAFFPKKIKNPRSGEKEYAAMTRPTGSTRYMVPSIFLFTSPDLYHWENQGILIEGTGKGHVGVNTPPIELEDGWLIIYHQHRHRSDEKREYTVSLKLFNEDLSKLLKETKEGDVFMDPHMEVQKKGIKDNVVFPGAAILHNDDRFFVYAGGGDSVATVHIYKLNNVIDSMKPV